MKKILLFSIVFISQYLFSQTNIVENLSNENIFNKVLSIDDGKKSFLVLDSTNFKKLNKNQKFDPSNNYYGGNSPQTQFVNRTNNVKNINVSRNPEQVLISKDNKYAFVRCFLSNTIEVIDIQQNQIIKSLNIAVPKDMVINCDSSKIFVASFVNQIITNYPIDDCTLNGFWSMGKTILTTINIAEQSIIQTDTIYTDIVQKIFQSKADSIIYLVGYNCVIEFDINSRIELRRWGSFKHIFYSDIDAKNNIIFVSDDYQDDVADSLIAIDIKTGIIKKTPFYEKAKNISRNYFAIDTASNRLFIQGQFQPYSEVLVFNTVTLNKIKSLPNLSLFYYSFCADPDLGSVFMTKTIYEYPYLDNTAELDYNTLEIKNELPTELTDSWKTILHDKVNNQLFSFQQGACPDVLQRINPPSNLDLIEYNLENGEIFKYITTDSVFECSYERSMAISSDGNFIIITNSPDNSISIIELSASGTEEIAHTTNVNLFPNPCSNFIHVSIKHAVTNDFSVEIYNRTGQMIRNMKKDRYETEFKIDVDNYPAGQYFIRIFNSTFCYTCKFQKI